ncbi:epidermal growth factor receptor [Patella vulgata]|uniref:epidermal growth factor receptor n=1 Tax=Patella vulgata TaxID=6465 RepID=UPI0024A84F75|nr:epidermal growth factor receptor [Patella vulgata]
MYPDENNICRKCHKNCADGCTGNSDIVGPGGCNSCEVGFRKSHFTETIRCLPTDTNSCPDSHHLTPVKIDNNNLLGGKRMCEPCHRLCQTCYGASNMNCNKCKFFEADSCVDFCPTMTFGNKATQKCEPCFDECRSGCRGSESTDCLACKNFKIYIGEDDKRFNCTDECPHLPYSVLDNNTNSETASRTVCADNTHPEVIALLSRNAEDEKKKMAIIVAPSVAGVLIVAVLIACIAWCCQKRAKAKKKTAKLTAKMTGWDEEVPLTPTTAKPDLAQLKLIKEYDLRRGGIIGSGAFGTVYKDFGFQKVKMLKFLWL